MFEVAFYKAHGGTILDHLIAGITNGPFSHCELKFSDGMYFSSSNMFSGTSFHTFEELTAKKCLPHNWVYVPVAMTPEEEQKIRDFCEEEGHCGYDYFGVLGFVFPFFKPSKNRWWCSEIAIAALQQIGLENKFQAYHQSPNSLYEDMTGTKF